VDYDPDMGCKTRERLCTELEASNGLLIGSHFSEPTAGIIEKTADGYRLKFYNR